jgi:methionyl-tRNA formyltransferase
MEDTKNKKIIFWGTPQFAVPCLSVLCALDLVTAVVTQPDKSKGRGRSDHAPSPVKQVALKRAIPVLQPELLNDRFIEALLKFCPATFCIVAYGKLIAQSVLDVSELPAINIHPSLLPDLRGPSPIQTALRLGYEVTGVSLIQVDKEMDHGPILAQKKVAISPTDTLTSLSEKISFASAQFVQKYIPRYLESDLKAMPQDHSRATFTKLLKADDGLLDLDKTAVELHNVIRALNPWPGTYLMWNKKRLKLLRSTPVKQSGALNAFSRTSSGRLGIRCKGGALEIETVQLEGKKPMSSIEFLNGYPDILST